MKNISALILYCILLNIPVLSAQENKDFKSKLTATQLTNAPAKLIPFPQQLDWNKEFVGLKGLQISSAAPLPNSLSIALEEIADFYNIDVKSKEGLLLNFETETIFQPEEYQLATSKTAITIKAATEAGHFYALQTLQQLFQQQNGKLSIPILRIRDWPTHSVRGFMIDTGRNFQSIASLKKQLDIMANYKLNVFQWHLTDRPAWRIESKKYPQLTAAENHRPTRNPGKFYTYEEIRELIRYAKERHIKIIPEMDMPGHSDSFKKAMGVAMESPKGMAILEEVLKEFFTEIPKEDCPIIHIGSDEVKIDDPEEFMTKMVGICEDHGRQVMIWNPGLKTHDQVLRQTWRSQHIEKGKYKEIDSWNSYINNGEPMTQIQRLFFKPIGYLSENEVIGGILCLWPDVNLEKGTDAFEQNPVYSSLLTYAWTTWTADVMQALTHYYMTLPPKGSSDLAYFRAFEEILVHHKEQFFKKEPFPYYLQSDKNWQVIGPFNGDDGDKILEKSKGFYAYQDTILKWNDVVGNTLVVNDRFRLGGYFPKAKAGQTVYAQTFIHSDKNRNIETWIGFETPMRANRTYTGLPNASEWDANGGNIWINGEKLAAPNWENAGWKPSKSEGWGTPKDQERPWHKEELYWTRTPTTIALKKGWNTVFAKIPCSSNYQNWMFTFVPLQMEGLTFATNPQDHSTYYYQKKTHFEHLPNAKKEIIFIGDSITDGCEWSELFGNKKMKNRGISGDVAQGVLDRLGEVTESKPKKVFLMIGVNDLARGQSTTYIIERITEIVATINQQSPTTKIFVQSILPVNDHYGKFGGHTDKNDEIITINQALAKGVNGQYQYIDLHTAFLDRAGKLDISWSNDGLHLNGKAYQLWASLIEEWVK